MQIHRFHLARTRLAAGRQVNWLAEDRSGRELARQSYPLKTPRQIRQSAPRIFVNSKPQSNLFNEGTVGSIIDIMETGVNLRFTVTDDHSDIYGLSFVATQAGPEAITADDFFPAPVTQFVFTVPEPTTSGLAKVSIGIAMSRRRRNASNERGADCEKPFDASACLPMQVECPGIGGNRIHPIKPNSRGQKGLGYVVVSGYL